MKPAPFLYHRPETVDEALELLLEHGDDAKIVAGGQSLVPAMNFRLAQPAVLVDINGLTTLDYVRIEEGAVRIGATVSQRAVERSPDVARRAPLLHEAMPWVAHPQIRNRGTVCGSLAHADPAAELPAVALATDATLVVRNANGERRVSACDFFKGLFWTDLESRDLLVEVVLPPLPPRSGWAFDEIARRHGDFAMAGVAVRVALDDAGRCAQARIAFLSVGGRPVRAGAAETLLVGELPSPGLVRSAAREAAAGLEPPTDIHATGDYRRHLAAHLAEACLGRAFARAREGGAA